MTLKRIFFAALLPLLCAIPLTAIAAPISLQDAKKTVLTDAAMEKSSVRFTAAHRTKIDGAPIYRVEFFTQKDTYSYEIFIADGKIREKHVKPRERTHFDGDSNSYIPPKEARAIAVNHAGYSIEDAAFSKTLYKKTHKKTIYELRFFKDGVTYDYKLDARTGDVLAHKTDGLAPSSLKT